MTNDTRRIISQYRSSTVQNLRQNIAELDVTACINERVLGRMDVRTLNTLALRPVGKLPVQLTRLVQAELETRGKLHRVAYKY